MPIATMFCKKCGKELTQDARFCLHCGEPITPTEEPADGKTETGKKKRKVKFWLIGAASVLFAAGVLIAVFFADITAWAERLILSPEMLMKKAVASAVQDMGIGTGEHRPYLDTPRRYGLELYLNEEIQNLFSTEEGDTWISDLNLQIATGKEDDLQRMQMSLLVKEASIVSLDIIQNSEKAWIGIPELNRRYLEFKKEELDLEQFDTMTENLPSEKEMTDIFRTYGAIMLDSIHRVTKENTTLEVAGVRQKVLKLTATILPEDNRKVFSQMAQELKEDKTAQRLLGSLAGVNANTELINSLEILASNADWQWQLICYLDSYNKLTGLELLDGDGQPMLYWAKAADSAEFASLLTCADLVLAGKGTCTDGKKTGEYQLSVDGKTVLTYYLKDFAAGKNGFSGSILFPVPRSLTQSTALGLFNVEMGLELSQESVSGEERLALKLLVEDKAYVGLIFTEGEMRDFIVDRPKAVTPANGETVEKWLQSFDWSVVGKRLEDTGVPINILGSLAEE